MADKPPKPTHYKVLAISLYIRDIEALDAMVVELKNKGWKRANRSHLIRLALNRLDDYAMRSIAARFR